MKDSSYSVQIFLDDEDNGAVKATSRQCPMGEYKCHHVAAAFLYGYKRASITDVKCSWMKHPKSAPPKTTLTMSELYPPKQPGYSFLMLSLIMFIYKYFIAALHWNLADDTGVQEVPVPLMDDWLMKPNYLSAKDTKTWLRQHLVVSQKKVKETAYATIGQRENSLWAAVRKLRFTASNFGQILVAANRNRLSISLKKRLLSAYNLEKRAPIQWGVAHEKNGIEEYCKKGGVTVGQTGIWLHESGVLGASPDGFVQGEFKNDGSIHHQCRNHLTSSPDIVEVKCPYTARDMTIWACESIKDFFLEMSDDGKIVLKQSHDYWHQIQGQLYLTGTQCCDLAVWTTKDFQVIRITKD
ncbi:uncharacterized protein LOC132565252 [Ylistrum balloti]|uniref:uncharacterized protein LOC132565252 n=1 Tax=Ylistrum balloti TaxID=509963 RepID=UPI002905B13F|nr:uncharacterized protein LOC132565252 [Ylistrum balloti]